MKHMNQEQLGHLLAPSCVFSIITLIGCWAQDLMVSQPGLTEATEGESAMLRCSYNSTSYPEVGSYRWEKDPGEVAVKNTTQEFMDRLIAVKDQDFLQDRKADIEIKDLRHYDSGGVSMCGESPWSSRDIREWGRASCGQAKSCM